MVANYAIFYSPTNVNNIKKFIKQLSLSDFTNWLKTQPANNFFDTYEYVTKDDKNSGQTAYQYFLENNSVAQPLFESLIQTGLSDNLISPIQISFTFNPQTAYLNSQIKEYVKNYNVQETLNAPSTYIYKFLTPQISLGNALYNNKNQITLNPTSDLTAQAAINSSNLSQTETQIKNALVNLFSSYWVGADQYFTAADANNITFSNITATSNNTVSLDVSYANQGLQYLNNNNEPVSLPLTIVTGFGNQTQPNKNDSQKIANSINHLLNNLSQPLTISGYQSQFLPTIAYNNSSANHDAVEQANTISALTQLVNNTLKNLSAQDSAGFNPKNVAVTINPQSLNNAQGTLSINVTYDGLNAGSNLTVHGFLTQSQQNTAIQAALNNALKNGINASSLSVTQSSLLSNTAMQVTLKNQALSLISSVLTNQQVNGQYINPSNLVFSN